MICRETVMQLYRRGLTYAKIARQLNCSEKQVGRIVIEQRRQLDKTLHKMARRGNETESWCVLHNCGFRFDEISELTGVSRQYLYDSILNFQEEE